MERLTTSINERIIGIMGAMPEEISEIVQLLTDREERTFGQRTYYTGRLQGIKTVVVFSRWGKVAAATTVINLILEFGISELLFIGVAGAIHPELSIGDIVVANRLVQHDMDARPLMPRHEIPLLGVTWFDTDAQLRATAQQAVESLLNRGFRQMISAEAGQQFGIQQPKLWSGAIASGDQFFAQQSQRDDLHQRLPEVLCVEMEGAAVAQVCYEYGLPFVVVRTISDGANEQSHIDFPAFIREVASRYSVAVIGAMFRLLSDSSAG
jgi:adenosylhomocysteine nucleosidase